MPSTVASLTPFALNSRVLDDLTEAIKVAISHCKHTRVLSKDTPSLTRPSDDRQNAGLDVHLD